MTSDRISFKVMSVYEVWGSIGNIGSPKGHSHSSDLMVWVSDTLTDPNDILVVKNPEV